MSAVSIQLMPASMAAWQAASESASSAPPQRPPNTHVPRPTTDSSMSVPPSRRRSIASPRFDRPRLLGRQRDQQPTVVVVGGEEVGRRGDVLAGPVGPEGAGDVQHAHAPLQALGRRVALREAAQPEPLLHLVADQLALLVAGDREGRVAGDEDAPLLIADDQGRLGARVVVLEQLEGEAEAAAGAAAGLVAHISLAARLAVRAAGTEEDRY